MTLQDYLMLAALVGVMAVVGTITGVLLSLVATKTGNYVPKKKDAGQYVAEVWLEWPICRGSTMYRQRFNTQRGAYLAVRLHALLLDWHLPRYYWDIDWVGRALQLKHDYGIYYGVRQLNDEEREDGVRAIWSPVLPGEKDFSGLPPGF